MIRLPEIKTAEFMHIRVFCQVSPGPLPCFACGPGNEATTKQSLAHGYRSQVTVCNNSYLLDSKWFVLETTLLAEVGYSHVTYVHR